MSLLDERAAGDKFWELHAKEILMTPNYGDYLAYNELVYQFMARDQIRQSAYEKVIKQKVKDKVVVEIGSGSQLIWTLLCIEHGAKKIYAIEENEMAYLKAKQLVNEKGLTNKIELIHGLSLEVTLPEKADICISEIIGCIGGSEGVARYLNDAKRFLKPGGIMIPEGCLTWISPVFKPIDIYQDDFLHEMEKAYIEVIHQKLGREVQFTRYDMSNFPRSNLISSPVIFEEMWFDDEIITEEFDKKLVFQISKNSFFDGLLLWINLHIGCGILIDPLNSITNWTSVYIPMDKVSLKEGDIIEVHCRSEISSNGTNPNYFFDCNVKRDSQEIYHCLNESYHALPR